METVTVKGKVYQLRTLYFCVETDRFGYISGLANSGDFRMNNIDYSWHTGELEIVERVLIGTIEDAPIELEDGEWYMCHNPVAPFVGCYNKQTNKMESGEKDFVIGDYAMPLYKMVKAK